MSVAIDSRCLRLRAATAALHRHAETRPLITALLRGTLALADYTTLLRNLQPLYAALETRLDETRTLPAAVRGPALRRREALERDLCALIGPDWAQQPPDAAALAYAAHLQAIDAPGLLAHAWLRYLGDLAGGQMLARAVGRLIGQDDGDGCAFYRFPSPGPAALASGFRAALDTLPLTAAEEQRLVDEACAGFRRHAALFDALYERRG